ncbi:hypothetical protein KB206_01725 [Microvirga sp. STS02]|nr:hypothetical protein [Microvirga sp. STS02]MBR7207318.1 hypothetical protein [Microvirga sp. STS02]
MKTPSCLRTAYQNRGIVPTLAARRARHEAVATKKPFVNFFFTFFSLHDEPFCT